MLRKRFRDRRTEWRNDGMTDGRHLNLYPPSTSWRGIIIITIPFLLCHEGTKGCWGSFIGKERIPGQVTTLTQVTPNGYYPSTLGLISPSLEGWQAGSTPPDVYSTAWQGLEFKMRGPSPNHRNCEANTRPFWTHLARLFVYFIFSMERKRFWRIIKCWWVVKKKSSLFCNMFAILQQWGCALPI